MLLDLHSADIEIMTPNVFEIRNIDPNKKIMHKIQEVVETGAEAHETAIKEEATAMKTLHKLEEKKKEWAKRLDDLKQELKDMRKKEEVDKKIEKCRDEIKSLKTAMEEPSLGYDMKGSEEKIAELKNKIIKYTKENKERSSKEYEIKKVEDRISAFDGIIEDSKEENK